MRFDGIHHVTCITADAPRNVDFYTRVLGLRLVKKTVNQDDPTVYHLFYADEEGNAGSDITFFEYPNARPGQAGDGMVHTVVWRVGSADALEFWAERLSAEGHEVEADGDALRFANPEGLAHELVVAQVPDEPLVAHHPEIPREVALQGFEGVRAYGRPVDEFLAKLGFEQEEDGRWERAPRRVAAGSSTPRRPTWPGSAAPEPSTTSRGLRRWRITRPGTTLSRRRAATRRRSSIASGSARSTSASRPASSSRSRPSAPASPRTRIRAHLGEKLILPPAFEHLRDRVEPVLTPLPDPRADWGAQR